MIVTCVHIHVKPEKIASFIEATITNHMGTVKEAGNLRFDLIQKADEPDKFMIYEAFESDEAAASHKTTPHYLLWRDLVSDFMAEPRQGVKYNIIEPSKRSEW